MGHFGEIRLADPVFSAVVLPSNSISVVIVSIILLIQCHNQGSQSTLKSNTKH